MKIISIISILLFSGCSFMGPNKYGEKYFTKISYHPKNYESIVGEYSTGPNLSGDNLKLFSDSTYQHYSWGDLLPKGGKFKGEIGKYSLSMDTLKLFFWDITTTDSLDIFRKKLSANPIIINQNEKYAQKYLFVNIYDDVFIIYVEEKESWIENYDFVGNIENRIISHELKKIVSQ